MTTDTRLLNTKAQTIIDAAKREGRGLTAAERATVESLIKQIEDTKALDAAVAEMGAAMSGNHHDGRGLFAAIRTAGFDRREHPSVVVPFGAATFGAVASFDGDYADARRIDITSPPLGADQRFLYPVFASKPVDPDATSVASFRQKSRTLPSLSAMVRTIAATTEKPEVATQTELLTEELKQIAVTEQGTPNIYLESQAFAGWINDDLRFAFSSALDYHAVTQIAAAGPDTATAGGNFLETIVEAAEVVASAGYAPSVLAASPENLIALRLMSNIGTAGGYLAGGMDAVLSGLRRVAVPALTSLGSAYVLDPAAAGTLYASQVRVAAFEENSGQTNTSTVRIEANGLFLVQRVGAICEVAVAS